MENKGFKAIFVGLFWVFFLVLNVDKVDDAYRLIKVLNPLTFYCCKPYQAYHLALSTISTLSTR